MAMTKEYDPERDGPKRPRPPMFGKPSAGKKPRPFMPRIIDDTPLPTIPGTNEPDYPIYLPPMPVKPTPGKLPSGASSQENLKKAARGAAIMNRLK